MDFRAVVLKGRLAAAVQRLNPKLPPAAVEEVVHGVMTPTETSLARKNRAFHRLLMDGVKVEFTNAEGEKEADHAQLIDFQNPGRNDFLVVNQPAHGRSRILALLRDTLLPKLLSGELPVQPEHALPEAL